MLVAAAMAKTLRSLEIKKVFVYPGGTMAPLLHALIDEGVEYVCPRNEQGAGYAALGAAKITGTPQVVMVTSGPGVTNVLTPIADAYFDSVPLLVFTGQVATKDINKEKKIRQTGFQEVDTISIFKEVTKKAHQLSASDNIPETIASLFKLSMDGRSGPVLIDMPMDVQKSETNIDEATLPTFADVREKKDMLTKEAQDSFARIAELISKAERPLILAGNGIYLSDAVQEFRSFVETYNIPIVCSLPGLGTIPSDHPLCFSYVGHTGEYFANLAAFNADVLIGLGARFDLRQTGTEVDELKKNKTVVRVDIDERELAHGRMKGDINVHMDLKQFFTNFKSTLPKKTYEPWLHTLREWKKKCNSTQFYEGPQLYSYDIVKAVDKSTAGKKLVITTGVGGHQQMAARYFTFDYPKRKWLTSSGHGTMGYDVPAMIGAMIAEDKDTLGVVFVGDGSFQMNIQELATIKELNLPVKIFVLDNKKLGVVSQFQVKNLGSDPSTGNKINPSFSKIGIAYGLKGFDIRTVDEIAPTLSEVFNDTLPAVIHCHIDYSEETKPMLLAGQKMNEMFPFETEKS